MCPAGLCSVPDGSLVPAFQSAERRTGAQRSTTRPGARPDHAGEGRVVCVSGGERVQPRLLSLVFRCPVAQNGLSAGASA